MSKLVNSILNYIQPFVKYTWIILIIVIFLLVGYYGYKRYAAPAISDSVYKDVANANRRGLNADIYFFHADWCPHCKKAAPEWKDFQDEYNGKSVNGYTIVAHDFNCTEDSGENSNEKIAEMVQKYNIQGYPTIIITTDDGKTINFESKITKKSLETFVNSAL
jgi:thiol-disulfide isomerase/thioredoxin